jgi:calcium/calmodulin-dependent protein kinase I
MEGKRQHPLPRPYNPSDDILPIEDLIGGGDDAVTNQGIVSGDGSFSLFAPDGDASQMLTNLPDEHGKFEDDDDDGDQEFHGLLDLHQSGFDPSAISVITSMTTMEQHHPERNVPTPPPPVSQYQYPIDPPEPNSTSGMRFDELYRLKGVLGTGAFSTVREGFHRSSTTISFAVKCINRKKLSEEDEAALLDEVSILKEMKHDHIIRLFDFFEEPATYYLVMERMRGGELFDRIVAKAYYNEKEARDTCKIVLEAVCYCHENHVAHRDLKPENLLLLSDVDDSAVKIADFGFAKKVYEPNSLTTQCGTPGYVAPEILEGTAYDQRADMWSVGVILYILLGGYPPFIESTQRDLFRKIRKGDYEFHEEYWGTVSSEAKELISSLLTVDRTVRLTADEALENAWILGDDAKLAQRDLGDNLHKLRNFNGKRKFRAAVSTVLAVNKLNLVGKEFFSHYGGSKDNVMLGAVDGEEES